MRKIVLAAEAAAKAIAQGATMTDPLTPCPLVWEQHTRQPYVADGLISARGTACEFAVHCPDCDISTPQFATAAEAVACWNQRAPKALAAEGADPETEWARILYRADYDGQGKLTQPNWPNPDTWDLSGALGHQYRRQARAIRAALSAITDPTPCPSCGGLNTSCPKGCGRDPVTGELNGTDLVLDPTLVREALAEATGRIEYLERRLEVVPGWSESVDGIACRDDTIRLQDAHIERLEAENRRLRQALEPFANPPLYVFDKEQLFVPAPHPRDWIGGGLFSTEDFRRARTALEGKEQG